ncbi:MAG: hypothetical protein K8I27_17170 [Planctomycetes bacterium]|nr:hypothetical protein [Planctomycetota bacterium]
MIRRTLGISAGLLLIVATTISGQETETKKSLPFEFKVSGDTVETFKSEFKLNAKLDQSTPEGLINSYALLTDNRSDVSKALEDSFKPVQEIVRKAEQPIRAKLFSEEMNKKVSEAEKPDEDSKGDSDYRSEPTEVTNVTDGDNGARLVETVQKTSYMTEAWDPETGEPTGKMEKHEDENKFRYTCIKGEDGSWRIERVESWQQDWDNWNGMDDEPAYKWTESATMVHWMLKRESPAKPEELKQDTPENAALSLFNHLLRQRETWSDTMQQRALRGWIDAIMPMFTEKGLKGPEEKKEEGEEEMEGFDKSPKREVEFVSDDADGVKRVKFKQTSEWFGSVEVYVKKDGETWKIIKAGYYETDFDMDSGGMKETEFVEENNLDMLSWR